VKREARMMADHYMGGVAGSREANRGIAEYGQPVVVFQHGKTSELN